MDDTGNISSNGSENVDIQGNSQEVPFILSACVLFISIFITGINTFVLILLIIRKTLRAKDHVNIILCLSLSDLYVGIAGILFGLIYTIPGWESDRGTLYYSTRLIWHRNNDVTWYNICHMFT